MAGAATQGRSYIRDATSLTLLQHIRCDPGSDSWNEFFDCYGRLIDRWLGFQGLAAEDRDDICQEVMTIVVQRLPGFEHNGQTGALRNWLRKITAHATRQFWRRSQKSGRSRSQVDLNRIANELADGTSDLSLIWNQEHDRHIVDYLLKLVSVQFQPDALRAFRLMFLELRSADEVATILNTTPNAARISQTRVLRALRQAGADLLD